MAGRLWSCHSSGVTLYDADCEVLRDSTDIRTDSRESFRWSGGGLFLG